MMQHIYAGVDVSKDWLDVFHPTNGPYRVENRPDTVQAFVAEGYREGLWLVFEGEPDQKSIQ